MLWQPQAITPLKQPIAFSWWAAVFHWPFSFSSIPDGSLMQAFTYASPSDRNALPWFFLGHFHSHLPHANLTITFSRNFLCAPYWILFLCFFSSIQFFAFHRAYHTLQHNVSPAYFFMLSLIMNIAANKIITNTLVNFSGDNIDLLLSLTKKSGELGTMTATC